MRQDPEADAKAADKAAADKATIEANMKKAMRKGVSAGSMLSIGNNEQKPLGNEQKPPGRLIWAIDRKFPNVIRNSKLGGG